MADEQTPSKGRPESAAPSHELPRRREKYPTIPLPPRRPAWRPEIPAEPLDGNWWLKRLSLAAVWCLVLVMAAGAMLRIFLHDWWIPLVWWNAFTLYVYLPAYVCLAIAVVIRRWRLAAVAGLVIVCHLAWIAPDFIPRAAQDAEPPPAEVNRTANHRLRLYYQNVHMHAEDFTWRIEKMLGEDSDIIALVEFTPNWEDAVAASDLPELYPHNTLRENPRSQQMAVFSKLPLEDVTHRFIAGQRLAVAATVRIGGHAVRLFCIHVPRPVLSQADAYHSFGREVIHWLDQTEGPRIVVGDFNSTQHAAWYRRLKTVAGLHSAHREVGRGYAVTWPSGRFYVPPIRIDHLLLSQELTCLSVREGDGGQSDHKPLIGELLLAIEDDTEEDERPRSRMFDGEYAFR